MEKYQVIVIGGGATGVGILRDLSMRGISTLLLEQGDLAHGTSSRFHGLLHSGARYAVTDYESAVECIEENYVLKKVARQCISDTKGWFVQTQNDSPDYVDQWIEACAKASIPIREISLTEAHQLEPMMSKDILRVFEVPDATVDGFKIVWANASSAKRYGGQYKTYHRMERLIVEKEKITGVVAKNLINGEEFEIRCDIVINATGAWASNITDPIRIPLNIISDKGTLLAFNQRLFQRVINRLHPPSDGDIFVPHETITILGTTSKAVDSPEENYPDKKEIEKLLELGAIVLPDLNQYRIIRAFSGVRPLYQEALSESSSSTEQGRDVSRSFALIDHEIQNSIPGLISIVGGKFTTYRLMAEKVSDLVAKKLGNELPCRTSTENLMPEIPAAIRKKASHLLPHIPVEKMLERLNDKANDVLMDIESSPNKGQIVCECEMVTIAEIEQIASDPDTHNLADIRRKTRLGMGTCQGAFCTYRALPYLWQNKEKDIVLEDELKEFLNQRWKGIRPVLFGQQLRETELTRAIYTSILHRNKPMNMKEEILCGMVL